MYKYQSEIDKIDCECPPSYYEACCIDAYRWVFDDINSEENFKPQFYKYPPRLNDPSDKKCKSLGLSMYKNLEKSKKRFEELKEIIENPYKELGTKVAFYKLTKQDGVNGKENKRNSHFTHHPFNGTNYSDKFEVISDL